MTMRFDPTFELEIVAAVYDSAGFVDCGWGDSSLLSVKPTFNSFALSLADGVTTVFLSTKTVFFPAFTALRISRSVRTVLLIVEKDSILSLLSSLLSLI